MKRIKPPKSPSTEYEEIWRIVDGAVIDCLKHHPEYIAKGIPLRSVRNSIVKRVTGAVVGFSQERRRVTADMEEGVVTWPSAPGASKCQVQNLTGSGKEGVYEAPSNSQ